MSGQNFFSKLNAAVASNDSLLCVGLDPTPEALPHRFHSQDASPTTAMLNWNRAIIDATHDLAAAYKPNIAFYEAMGEAGAELLHATLEYIPDAIPVLLDAKRGDIGSTAAAYAKAVFEQWQVDAVTLSPYLGKDSIQPFIDYTNKGLFLLCHTSNPGASDFQHLEISDWRTLDREANAPLYIHVARVAVGWATNIGLVVGATYPDAIAAVRRHAPDTWFLIPGIGAQGGELEATVRAGLRNDGSGIIINVGRGISLADDMASAARQFREEINQTRATLTGATSFPAAPKQPEPSANGVATSSLVAADAGHDDPFLHELTVRLVELGAIKFGSFTLASGIQSPIYIDLRLLVSEPALLAQVATAYAQRIRGLIFDRLAGVPYAALPIATALSLHTGRPMIYPRKEAKAYGLGKDIEGNWHAGERILVVEDLITSGGSIIKTAERFREVGMNVEECVVLIDRAQGGREKLAAAGILAHSVFNIHDMIRILEAGGHITLEMAQSVRDFLGRSQV